MAFKDTRNQWKYHVFLSFRGEDTRKSFTDHLFATLKQKGVFAFRDDKKLEKGNLFHLSFQKEQKNHCLCLDELVKIMECSKKMGLIVLPIFYDVDPSVVKKQTGTYAHAFEEHEIRFQENIKKVHTQKCFERRHQYLWMVLTRQVNPVNNIISIEYIK